MRKLILFVFVLLICISLSACGKSLDERVKATVESTMEPTPSSTEVTASSDPSSQRKEKYQEAEELIKNKQYKEADEILQTLNKYKNSEFPDLNNLKKKIRVLELERIRKWKDRSGEDQIIISDNKVSVNICYYDHKLEYAKYKGKINNKRSTPYKIAVEHKGKMDYIHIDNLYRGSIEYEIHNVDNFVSLYSADGLQRHIKNQERLKEYYEEKRKEESSKPTEPTEQKTEPRIGMAASDVEKSSWGKPNKKNITEYEWGISEQWVYSGNRYIYIKNGIVTSIQRSE